MESSALNRYYLQVVKDGDKPSWPRPEEELVVGSQDLSGGFTQYWAYHQESAKNPDDLPGAEIVASENPAAKPAILIDQPRPLLNEEEDDVLDLILVKDSHAWIVASSSVSNLEDNLSQVIEEGEHKFTITVEHFMTTDRVDDEVEKKLDQLEETEDIQTSDIRPAAEAAFQTSDKEISDKDEGNANQNQLSDEPTQVVSNLTDLSDNESDGDIPEFRHVASSHLPSSGIYSSSQVKTASFLNQSGRGNKLWILVPVIVLLLVAGGAFKYRNQILSMVGGSPASTPLPLPVALPTMTPTPTIAPIERKDFKVRVLNGTTTSGLAATLSDKLKTLGWTINKTGNNDTQSVTTGLVAAKAKLDANVIKTLLLDLGSKYSSSSSALKETDSSDLEVIIGKENEN